MNVPYQALFRQKPKKMIDHHSRLLRVWWAHLIPYKAVLMLITRVIHRSTLHFAQKGCAMQCWGITLKKSMTLDVILVRRDITSIVPIPLTHLQLWCLKVLPQNWKNRLVFAAWTKEWTLCNSLPLFRQISHVMCGSVVQNSTSLYMFVILIKANDGQWSVHEFSFNSFSTGLNLNFLFTTMIMKMREREIEIGMA